MVLETDRHADGLIDEGHVLVDLFLRLLHTALDIADRLEILIDLRLVGRADAPSQGIGTFGHGVQDAAPLPDVGGPGVTARAVSGAEHPFEDDARIHLHRQRCRRVSPAERVEVGAAVTEVAGTGHFERFESQLQGSQLRLAPELRGGNLVHGDTGVDARTLGREGPGSGQPCGLTARMDAAVVRVGLLAVETAHHDQAIPERRQRSQDRSRLQRALGFGRPELHVHPHSRIHDTESSDGRWSRRECGRHAVEERQGKHGTAGT